MPKQPRTPEQKQASYARLQKVGFVVKTPTGFARAGPSSTDSTRAAPSGQPQQTAPFRAPPMAPFRAPPMAPFVSAPSVPGIPASSVGMGRMPPSNVPCVMRGGQMGRSCL